MSSSPFSSMSSPPFSPPSSRMSLVQTVTFMINNHCNNERTTSSEFLKFLHEFQSSSLFRLFVQKIIVFFNFLFLLFRFYQLTMQIGSVSFIIIFSGSTIDIPMMTSIMMIQLVIDSLSESLEHWHLFNWLFDGSLIFGLIIFGIEKSLMIPGSMSEMFLSEMMTMNCAKESA